MEEQKVQQIVSLSVRRQLLLAYARGLADKARLAKASLSEAFWLGALFCRLRLALRQSALKRCFGKLEELVGFEGLKVEELLDIAEFYFQAGLPQLVRRYLRRASEQSLNPSADYLALSELMEAQLCAAEGNPEKADRHFRKWIGLFEAAPEAVSFPIQLKVLLAYADFLEKIRGRTHLAEKQRAKARLISAELGAAGVKVERGTY